MKKFLYLAVAAIAVLSSCDKNDALLDDNGNGASNANAPVFTAIIEGEASTRTSIGDSYEVTEGGNTVTKRKVNWENTDKVSINGAVYAVTPGAADATTATLQYESGSAPTSP